MNCGSLQVKLFYNYCRLSDRLRFKDRSSTVNNVVYHVECSTCEASYTGETKRNITTRMNEHGKTSTDSEVARHCWEFPDHKFNLDEPKILAFEHNLMKRRIKEALFIQELGSTLNKQEKSYNLYLFGVPTPYVNN